MDTSFNTLYIVAVVVWSSFVAVVVGRLLSGRSVVAVSWSLVVCGWSLVVWSLVGCVAVTVVRSFVVRCSSSHFVGRWSLVLRFICCRLSLFVAAVLRRWM